VVFFQGFLQQQPIPLIVIGHQEIFRPFFFWRRNVFPGEIVLFKIGIHRTIPPARIEGVVGRIISLWPVFLKNKYGGTDLTGKKFHLVCFKIPIRPQAGMTGGRVGVGKKKVGFGRVWGHFRPRDPSAEPKAFVQGFGIKV
jgi:hypothetical protein